jgi:hypothetical protein
VLSRCLQFNLKQMPREAIRAHLEGLLKEEKISCEGEALSLIGRAAAGSMRDALSLLDQAIAHGGGKITAAGVRRDAGRDRSGISSCACSRASLPPMQLPQVSVAGGHAGPAAFPSTRRSRIWRASCSSWPLHNPRRKRSKRICPIVRACRSSLVASTRRRCSFAIRSRLQGREDLPLAP